MTSFLASLLVAGALLVRPPSRRSALRRLRTAHRAAVDRPADTPAGETPLPTALVMELVAAALDAGLPPPAAVAAAIEAAGPATRVGLAPVVHLWQLGAPSSRVWRDADERWWPLARSLLLSERTGASAATVLRTAARDLRSARRRRARVRAHRLGVGLVVPLGLTTLPAFLLWAVVPVVLGLAREVLSGA